MYVNGVKSPLTEQDTARLQQVRWSSSGIRAHAAHALQTLPSPPPTHLPPISRREGLSTSKNISFIRHSARGPRPSPRLARFPKTQTLITNPSSCEEVKASTGAAGVQFTVRRQPSKPRA